MTKTNYEYVAESRQRAKEAGRLRAQAFMFSGEGSAMYKALSEKGGPLEGESQREILEQGLRLLAQQHFPSRSWRG